MYLRLHLKTMSLHGARAGQRPGSRVQKRADPWERGSLTTKQKRPVPSVAKGISRGQGSVAAPAQL